MRMGQSRSAWIALCSFIATVPFTSQAQPVDGSWTFSQDFSNDYRLTVVSSSEIFSGQLPADDPTLNLVVGRRYQVTVMNASTHPLQILAKGASSANDMVLLSQGTGTGRNGSFEADAGVAWSDGAGGVATFTLTQALFEAMQVGGRHPGYRCAVHLSTMRGDFDVTGGTNGPTATPTVTRTQTTTPTRTRTPSFTQTLAPTSTSTDTPESTFTPTPTQELTATPTETPDSSPTPSQTPTQALASPTPTNTPGSADLNGDNLVNAEDLLEFLRQWRNAPLKGPLNPAPN